MSNEIRLTDKNEVSIRVGDILYWKDRDTYFTVFEVPGGYAIESNPRSFGLYDSNDIFPVYESTADQQTSSFIKDNLEVIGNINIDKELLNEIKDRYESLKENRKTTKTRNNKF